MLGLRLNLMCAVCTAHDEFELLMNAHPQAVQVRASEGPDESDLEQSAYVIDIRGRRTLRG